MATRAPNDLESKLHDAALGNAKKVRKGDVQYGNDTT